MKTAPLQLSDQSVSSSHGTNNQQIRLTRVTAQPDIQGLILISRLFLNKGDNRRPVSPKYIKLKNKVERKMDKMQGHVQNVSAILGVFN